MFREPLVVAMHTWYTSIFPETLSEILELFLTLAMKEMKGCYINNLSLVAITRVCSLSRSGTPISVVASLQLLDKPKSCPRMSRSSSFFCSSKHDDRVSPKYSAENCEEHGLPFHFRHPQAFCTKVTTHLFLWVRGRLKKTIDY